MTLNPPPLPTETQIQQYLSCYRPNFDQTLKVGSWDNLEQIMVTIVQGTYKYLGNICPYQQYLSCYIHDFDQTFWTQFLEGLDLFGPTVFWDQTSFDTNTFGPIIFWT